METISIPRIWTVALGITLWGWCGILGSGSDAYDSFATPSFQFTCSGTQWPLTCFDPDPFSVGNISWAVCHSVVLRILTRRFRRLLTASQIIARRRRLLLMRILRRLRVQRVGNPRHFVHHPAGNSPPKPKSLLNPHKSHEAQANSRTPRSLSGHTHRRRENILSVYI